MHISSQLVQIGCKADPRTGSLSTPIYQTASFRHPALGESTGYDYTRSGNPTRQALEEGLARLEGGAGACAFSSGLAAITTLLMLYQQGDHLIVVEDCYGGTYRLFEQVLSRFGLTASYVDATTLDAIGQALRPETKAVFIETPTNPLLRIVDLRALASFCRSNNLHLIVDNTFLTPYFQRPLELGADLVVHSGTKYLAGHNDLLCGVIVAKEPELAEKVKFLQNATGAILSPSDSWLLIRSLKTLALRMEKHNANALSISRWLLEHPKVSRVFYPGLPLHNGHTIHESQASGYGGMVSFEVNDPALVPQVLAKVQLIQFAESLGGVETLITFPAVQTHADIPAADRERLGISDCLLRLSVGIEDADDLIADLDQALG
ncbi:PLP-dependent aspartate aminotransferase family protein [Anaeromusa sp.]|uniref:trans-sulfuration enzyme family protein n=1 Tax=Anaeromusa sp. TaxID=1872520 RepID=UPI00260F4089|nr:PLP-dependent aspartate aminotransferase family protein [Anaeromusa sp.]MDD3158852.1 PLP-dependent aspartate aminotransferase family protein [Anaeromusa sp.]NCB75941.1 PLP-dependent transferase [Negativicutes bacterium]